MPKVSEAVANARREEIIDACARLYQTMSFREITLKDIGRSTSFTRTSIYHYFQTKEEIFLALLQREYEGWAAELNGLGADGAARDGRALAEALAASLARRPQMLKLLSMNHFDMEEKSRPEALVAFKRAYGATLRAVEGALGRFCPAMPEEERKGFLYAYFPFIYGIYPYAFVTARQREAMAAAGTGYRYHSVYALAYGCAQRLLGLGPEGAADENGREREWSENAGDGPPRFS